MSASLLVRRSLEGLLCAVALVGLADPAHGAAEAERFFKVLRGNPAALPDGAIATDFGAVRWIRVPAGTDLSDPVQERAASSYRLSLGGSTFDPLHTFPDPGGVWGGWPTTQSGKALGLVQATRPLRSAELAEMRDAGLRPIRALAPFTWIVWGDRDRLASLRENPEAPIRWTGPFSAGFRVAPDARAEASGPAVWDVLLVRPERDRVPTRALDALAQIGTVLADARIDRDLWAVDVILDAAGVSALAGVPELWTASPEPRDGGARGEAGNQLIAGNFGAGDQPFPGYASWLSGLGLDGSGIVIANVDDGVEDDHPDLVSRMRPCSGSTCGGVIESFHGTHTAGIMAGDGSTGVTLQGFVRGLGVAPGAGIVEQLYSPTFTQPGGMLTLMEDSVSNGALVSGNSWGPAGSPRGYDGDTMQVDIGTRDADPDMPGHQPLLYVLSFMNGNGGTSSQGTPDEAKNILTVGSTWLQHSNGALCPNGAAPGASCDRDGEHPGSISRNSAHGPALDGRTIPHIVAPGMYVDSAATGHAHALTFGTSMASPHVSGAAALYLEGSIARRATSRGPQPSAPSPALVKAAFLATAQSLAGGEDADEGTLGQPFDSKQGWGRMDLGAVLQPATDVIEVDQSHRFDETGEEWSLVVSPSGGEVRVMLAWTDAPGHGLGLAGSTTPAWNNDLDLVVEADGQTYVANVFGPDGWSVPDGTPDDRNNTEGVFLPSPSGPMILRVVASNLNSDGVPDVGDEVDQDFALVCRGCLPDLGLFADGFESGDASAWNLRPCKGTSFCPGQRPRSGL